MSIFNVIFSLCMVACAVAFRSPMGMKWTKATRSFQLHEVPLELTGQLDASKKWDVTLIFEGETRVVSVSEGTSILQLSEKMWRGVKSSCRNGVCTTCAGQIQAGKENILMAVNCLGKPQLEAGFICTCQTYITGPGVTLLLGQYDAVDESQYGQFEKSFVKGEKK